MKYLRYQRSTKDRKRVPGLLRSARNDETDVSQRSQEGGVIPAPRIALESKRRDWITTMLQKNLKSAIAPRLGLGHNSTIFGSGIGEGARVYAICFALDQEQLRRHYPAATHTNAYEDIRRCLETFGFTRQQGSVYFGNANVTPVTCVMAVQDLQRRHSWFGKVVSDLRMLRIEEHNDLLPAIAQQEIRFPPTG